MRKIIVLPLAALLSMLALWLGGAVAATAAPGHQSCSRDLPVTHNANEVQMHAVQTCGFSYRAWGDWGGKYRYGTYTKVNGNNSTACDNPGPCTGHPDGTLFKGGYQVKRTGRYVTTFTTSIRTTAARFQDNSIIGTQNGKLRALLSGQGPYLICAKNTAPTLQRMGAYYQLHKRTVTGRPCDASREWEWYAQGDDINGVPQGNWKAVGDGWWLASSKYCAWTVRHSDRRTSGTLWKLFADRKGNFYVANARCSGVDSYQRPRYTQVMTTDNRLTSAWFIADRVHPQRGDYTKMILQLPPSAKAHATALRRSCATSDPECVHYAFHQFAGLHPGSEAGGKWSRNDGGWSVRGYARCANRAAGTAHNARGGWVTSLNLYSYAKCFQPEVMIHGAYQWKKCGSCAIHTFWFYPPSRKAASA